MDLDGDCVFPGDQRSNRRSRQRNLVENTLIATRDRGGRKRVKRWIGVEAIRTCDFHAVDIDSGSVVVE